MANCGRRRVLTYAGVAVAGGVLSTGVGTADGNGTESSAGARDWPSFRGNPGNTGYLAGGRGPEESAAVDWTYDHGGPVAVVDEVVYLVVDGRVHAVDADDGELLGETDDVGAAGGPAVTDDAIYVGGEGLTAIDSDTGESAWTIDFGQDGDVPSPVVVDGTVFVVSGGTLHAIDADDGESTWEFDPDDDSLFEQPVSVADGAVFATGGGALYAREAADGSERWAVDDAFEAGPIAATERVVLAPTNGETGVYDTGTGDRGWSEPGVPGLVTEGTRANVYTVPDGDLVGYRRNTGEEFWRAPVDASAFSLPVAAGPVIYVGIDGADGTGVAALDVETEAVEWIAETGGQPQHLAVTDDTVYASNGGLVAIRAGGDGEETFEDEETDDESETDDTDGNGSDDGNEGNESDDGGESTEDDGDDGELFDDEVSDDGDGDDESGDESEGNETGEDDDEMPGFTTGAGLIGGAVVLEWLRRRGVVASDEETSSRR